MGAYIYFKHFNLCCLDRTNILLCVHHVCKNGMCEAYNLRCYTHLANPSLFSLGIHSRRRLPTRSEVAPTSWNSYSERWTKSCWLWRPSTSSSTRHSDPCFRWWACTSSRWEWTPDSAAFWSAWDLSWSSWARPSGEVWLTGKRKTKWYWWHWEEVKNHIYFDV